MLKYSVYIPLGSVECPEYLQHCFFWHVSCNGSQTQTSSAAASEYPDDPLLHIAEWREKKGPQHVLSYNSLTTSETRNSIIAKCSVNVVKWARCFLFTHNSSVSFGITLVTEQLVIATDVWGFEKLRNAINLKNASVSRASEIISVACVQLYSYLFRWNVLRITIPCYPWKV